MADDRKQGWPAVWEAFDQALADQEYFLAHEVLETLWRAEHGLRQQAAIWVAAAFLHWHRGNYRGAERLLSKIRLKCHDLPPQLGEQIDDWSLQLAAQAGDPILTAATRQILIAWAVREN